MRQHVWEWRCWQADISGHLSINTITRTNRINLYLQLLLPETHNVLHNVGSVAFFNNIACFSNSGLETLRPYSSANR